MDIKGNSTDREGCQTEQLYGKIFVLTKSNAEGLKVFLQAFKCPDPRLQKGNLWLRWQGCESSGYEFQWLEKPRLCGGNKFRIAVPAGLYPPGYTVL